MGYPLSPDPAQNSVFMATQLEFPPVLRVKVKPLSWVQGWLDMLGRCWTGGSRQLPPAPPCPQSPPCNLPRGSVGKCWPGLGGGIQNRTPDSSKPQAAGDGGSMALQPDDSSQHPRELLDSRELPVYDVHWLGPCSPGPDIHRCQKAEMEDLQGAH